MRPAAALAVSFLLAGLFPAAPAAQTAPVEVERLELTVRVDPAYQALYARAAFFLRNRTYGSPDVLEFDFPAALADRVRLGSVWDRNGELGWRADEVTADGVRRLRVQARAPLFPGKKLVVVVTYDLELEGFAAADDGLLVSRDVVRLPAAGWYPQLVDAAAPPRALRLTARLPKDWQVQAPGKLKRLNDGTALASYEFDLKEGRPGDVLLRAGAPRPP